MPLPNILPNASLLEQAIETALVKEGVISPKEDFKNSLSEHGATPQATAQKVAEILACGKHRDAIAVMKDIILPAHEIELRKPETADTKPVISINIQSDNVNLQALFAPQRNINGNANSDSA